MEVACSESSEKSMVLLVEACETTTWPPVYAEGRMTITVANIPSAFCVLRMISV